jgi:hypothetical protein
MMSLVKMTETEILQFLNELNGWKYEKETFEDKRWGRAHLIRVIAPDYDFGTETVTFEKGGMSSFGYSHDKYFLDVPYYPRETKYTSNFDLVLGLLNKKTDLFGKVEWQLDDLAAEGEVRCVCKFPENKLIVTYGLSAALALSVALVAFLANAEIELTDDKESST